MYKKIVNPTEKNVNNILEEGYKLHSITPLISHISHHGMYKYDLIYHFIKLPVVNISSSDLNESFNNPFINK